MYCRFLCIFVCESDNSKSVVTVNASKYLNICLTLLDLTFIISLIITIIVSDGSCGREDKVSHIRYQYDMIMYYI